MSRWSHWAVTWHVLVWFRWNRPRSYASCQKILMVRGRWWFSIYCRKSWCRQDKPTFRRTYHLPRSLRFRHSRNAAELPPKFFWQWYHPWWGLNRREFTLTIDDSIKEEFTDHWLLMRQVLPGQFACVFHGCSERKFVCIIWLKMVLFYQYPSFFETTSSNLLYQMFYISASFFSISTYHYFLIPSKQVSILISFN